MFGSQDFFNTLKFEIVGDGKAPRFFKINQETGQISIARNLREDRDLGYVVCDFVWLAFSCLCCSAVIAVCAGQKATAPQTPFHIVE